ncbi:unnamed protein product [Ophioblennius macclurei]
MDSRRTTTRSSIGNGRTANGAHVNGNNRPGGCSYLSNVRPETRSTLCSVIAQLTEEMQPSFETTLKSRAVSENCNVKFSCVVTGYPAPQITWYKDDMQLDRYCGLPKYEIFRNGQNHSLHIYNCTLEDAAIYQASAINCKGIVSCSGVLEVGDMNEFKIHQRYFDKLKQKAEHKRTEAEGKENQEPLRTISPDRTQRKRRSTMEAFLSTPSSLEDEGAEENRQDSAEATETRLQEAAVDKVGEEPAVPVANGVVSALTNGQAIDDSVKESATHDSTQKISTIHQARSPFVKKKIKISSDAKVARGDTSKERVSVDRRSKDELLPSVARADAAKPKWSPEEAMEVQTVVSSESKNTTKELQKASTPEKPFPRRSLKDESISTRATVPAKKEHRLSASVSPAAVTSSRHAASGTEGKQTVVPEKKTVRKEAKESSEMQSPRPSIAPVKTQPSASSPVVGALKKDIRAADHVTLMDVDVKLKDASDGSVGHTDGPSADKSHDGRTALPQGSNAPSAKQTGSHQKKAPVPRPAAPPSEVTQAHAKMGRNDAPVSLEIPPDRHTIGSKELPKTPTERQTKRRDNYTTPSHSSLQDTKMDTSNNSRESNESRAGLVTQLLKPPLQSPGGVGGGGGGAVNTRERNVVPTVLQSQVDTAIKSDKGPKIHDREKVESRGGGESFVRPGSVAPNEKSVEMEIEPVKRNVAERTRNKRTKEAGDGEGGVVSVHERTKETNKNKPTSKAVEKADPKSETPKSDAHETPPLQPKPPGSADSLDHVKDFHEVQKPATKIISVAEMLRSQIKALETSIVPTQSNLPQDPSTKAPEPGHDLRDAERKSKFESEKSRPDRKTEESIVDSPPVTVKPTLVEVYNQIDKGDRDQNDQVQELLVVPSVSVVDTGLTVDIPESYKNAKKHNDDVMDIGQEPETPLILPEDVSVEQSSPPPMLKKDESNNTFQTISNQPETVSQKCASPVAVTLIMPDQETNVIVLGHPEEQPIRGKGSESIQSFIEENKLSKTEKMVTEMNLTSHSHQSKMEERHSVSGFVQNTLKTPSEGDFSPGKQENSHFVQPDTSVIDEQPKSDSFTSPTPEPSPSLKRRNCVSPIPSATPQELASGARRKILTPKAKPEELTEVACQDDNQTPKKETSPQSIKLSTSPLTPSASPSLSRRSPLLQPASGEQSPPVERRSPLVSRRKTTPEVQTPSLLQPDETQTEQKPAEKDKLNPFKAPQVIRKIRSENFADSSGHLKLWCQFFNVLSDSTITWFKNEEEIDQTKRNAGDEVPVNLAIVQASSKDAGVYGCSIANEYGTDSTDILLSTDILAGMSLREDLGVGEEIEMMPLIFSKGVADSGAWGNKFFGRIMMKESHIGDGCSHKVWRAKVIYGLEPVFESGNTCIIKVRNPIAYGGKQESSLVEKNLDSVKQECKIQNLAREYCKIFSAEARVLENFGSCLEVIPVYMMYRPANTVPYATVETDLTGVYQKYSSLDRSGRIDMRCVSDVEQKCSALQHWIFQWTSGNLLFTRLEGVDTKITNVGISAKSAGHQGLPVEGNPKVFENFLSQHKCNYFCGLLGLRSLKVMESLMTPSKPKGSRSPLLQRKMGSGSSSPQTGRKAAVSPRPPRKAEQDGVKAAAKPKAADASKEVKTP